jgi:hypothetical protein
MGFATNPRQQCRSPAQMDNLIHAVPAHNAIRLFRLIDQRCRGLDPIEALPALYARRTLGLAALRAECAGSRTHSIHGREGRHRRRSGTGYRWYSIGPLPWNGVAATTQRVARAICKAYWHPSRRPPPAQFFPKMWYGSNTGALTPHATGAQITR